MWLVQRNLVAGDQEHEVTLALRDLKIPFVEATCIPFDNKYEAHGELPQDGKIIPYGAGQLITLVDPLWKGLFFKPDRFKTSEWIKHHKILNKDANAAGFYDNDVRKIVAAITEYVESQ